MTAGKLPFLRRATCPAAMSHQPLDLETITEGQPEMGVATVLPEEIVWLAPYERGRHRGPPMLAAGLRVLQFCISASSILANDAFERHTPVRIDGVRRAADNRPGHAPIGRKRRGRSSCGDDFAYIAADEQPFALLSLELHDVKQVLVRRRSPRREVGDFTLDRQSTERYGGIRAIGPDRR